mgnify:CR=1 FL=1
MAAAARRLAVSVTAWFKVPELGMQTYEFLSRGSAFAVVPILELPVSPAPAALLVTAKHVVHPWTLPTLFPDAAGWLAAVEAKHVVHTVEVREEGSGAVVGQWVAQPQTYVHRSWDVAALYVAGVFSPLPLARRRPGRGELVRLEGHAEVGGDHGVAPAELRGRVVALASTEAAAGIAEVASNFGVTGAGVRGRLAQGVVLCTAACDGSVAGSMSGGPVLDEPGEEVLGMLVARVGDAAAAGAPSPPADDTTPSGAPLAAFLEAWAVTDFLLDVESLVAGPGGRNTDDLSVLDRPPTLPPNWLPPYD